MKRNSGNKSTANPVHYVYEEEFEREINRQSVHRTYVEEFEQQIACQRLSPYNCVKRKRVKSIPFGHNVISDE
ncbi:hypothetical protein, partial [Ferdinandcohnia sp. SAFN-114]|uniref:hypothetical protein n=1 Tax=Ferdinandcohnia sp. SAFN-114 TaxID=3387275 RepID=UPI003F823A9E